MSIDTAQHDSRPLAERMRPVDIERVVGQDHDETLVEQAAGSRWRRFDQGGDGRVNWMSARVG